MSKALDLVEKVAVKITKSAVTSRMARVPLEIQLEPFLEYPVKATTFRLPSKATRLTLTCGRVTHQRIIRDQSSNAILKASRTLAQKVLSEVSLEFVTSI